MRSNHFVIRNGKLVSKLQAQKNPQKAKQRLTIIKPTKIIVKNKQDIQDTPKNYENNYLTKKQYQQLIQIYQNKVKQLEKQVKNKKLISQAKLENQKSEQDTREGEQPINGEMFGDFLSKSLKKSEKAKTEYFQSVNSTQTSLQTKKFIVAENNYDKYERKESLYRTSKSPLMLPLNSSHQTINTLNKKSSHSTINTLNQCISARGAPLTQRQSSSRQSKSFFDTSTLLSRLNRSANLVKKIKRFLQYPSINNDQTCLQSQPSKTLTNQSTIEQELLLTQQSEHQQLCQFLEELLEKHQKIIDLILQLEVQKQQQINKIKQYYQQIINKNQLQKNYTSNIGHTSNYYYKNKNGGKMIENKKNKENKKDDSFVNLRGKEGQNKNNCLGKTQKYLTHQKKGIKLYIGNQKLNLGEGKSDSVQILQDCLCGPQTPDLQGPQF